MSESDTSENDIHEPAAFGQQLMLAREKAGMTIVEAARALNLKQEIVEAIEQSAMDKLPPVTFVQGYIRTYARLLELPEDKIISEFEQEVPHERESELQPRPPSPEGANSQTPVIKLVSTMVILLALLVLGYAVYDFYMQRTESIEQANHAADEAAVAELSRETPLVEQRESEFAETGADTPVPAGTVEDVPSEAGLDAEATAVEAAVEEAVTPVELQAEAGLEAVPAEAAEEPLPGPEDTPAVDVEAIMPVPTPQPMTGGDVMLLSAEEECWADIVDANDIRMFYGTILPGRTLEFTGQAPFEVFLGNAPAVTMSLNATPIDMTNYIRSNNIAQFKLSVEDGRARFH